MKNDLDDRLRDALRREEPPAGFADRILERLPAERPVVVELPVRRHTAPRFALAAAAALAVAAGSAWLVMSHGAIAPPAPDRVAETQVTPPGPTPARRPDPPPAAPPAYEPKPPAATTPVRRVRWTKPVPRPREDDVEAAHAAEQLRLALRITNTKLNVARHEVREALDVPQS